MATVALRDLVIRYITGLVMLDGRYAELSPISPSGGNGAFSIVFRAKDQQLGIPVILKFFDPGYDANHRRKEYFKREAEALLHLNDQRRIRHLVDIVQGHTVHGAALPVSPDTSVAHALEYYVMRPYPKTLEDYIYKEEHDLGESILTFREVVAGVHCAHRFEYCHRDLKPDNVLMRNDQYVAVSDFGSAKRLATLASRELEDYEPTPAGHYHYTSPELLAGLTTVEHFYSTDLFALGLILYEMLNRQKFYTKSIGYIALVTHLPQVPHHERTIEGRKKQFAEILRTVTATTPSVPLFHSSEGTPAFRAHAEDLFSQLTNFDFAHRLRNFEYIFGKIDRCLRTLGIKSVKREYLDR